MISIRWSLTESRSLSVAIVAVACLLMLSGCAATMVSTREELQNVAESEGVVFGSFVINVEKGGENEHALAFLTQKAGSATYLVSISQDTPSPFKSSYSISASPEKEEIFIRKLPAGDYVILSVTRQGYANWTWNPMVRFKVTPKQTTYIGKLVAKLPYRVTGGSRIFMDVVDAQQETTEMLSKEHPHVLTVVVKSLMTTRQ